MNTLEGLKERLMVKPIVDKQKQFTVAIIERTSEKKEQGSEEVNIPKVIDETGKGYDREAIMKKINSNRMTKVTLSSMMEKNCEIKKVVKPEPEIIQPRKKPKKIASKPLLIIEEEEEEKKEGEGEEKKEGEQVIPVIEEKKRETMNEMENIVNQVEKIIPLSIQLEEPNPKQPKKEEELEDIIIPITEKPKKTRERKTKKVEKGIAILGPESPIEIGNKNILARLPLKQPNINIKVSSYYMNNREIFVNFINSMFEPYKKEIEENAENISCENIGKAGGEVSLLTHQKVIRDYINIYTPYRGVLLYHGLGSGKTLSSIAIAEGMKDNKRIIVMTPASLRRNYMEELKKGGDALYKKNQFWEWIPASNDQDTINVLSTVLNLSVDYIKKGKGAWLVNVKKEPNYASLSASEKKSLDEQIDEMIRAKYTFINYNGLRNKRLEELTSGYTKNLFDDCVVIIDEAHNLISRIVNKIKKEKIIPENEEGEKEHAPKFLSTKLYEYLMSANNARIILLTGTPIINYPNEFGILFNILRGYIKTWSIPLDVKTSKATNRESLQELFLREKVLDYLDYSPASRILTVTRNPFGFKNKIKENTGYHGVSNVKKDETGKSILDTDYITDIAFKNRIISILRNNDIEILPQGIKVKNYKALPDSFEIFNGEYIDENTSELKNIDSLKRRIIGLSSYFRSAQEGLLPKFNKTPEDFHIVNIPMSNFQFKIYESARKEERKFEKPQKKSKSLNELYEGPSSTYRIFSRLFCNFVMPNRPMPKEFKKEIKGDVEKEIGLESILKEASKAEGNQDVNDENEGEVEGDEILEKIGDNSYQERMKDTLKQLKEKSNEFLTPEALETYSPKYLAILENIKDPEYVGLHLLYSQFRSLEGIGIFSLVLEKNGFTRFKIKKNHLDIWEIDILEEDLGKPTFALYTGTESAEEKEIIRNIYNSSWDYVPTNIANELKKVANNNNMGEIIKLLMITSSGSEGINLRNTRYVHVMEPYWHPVRMEQVIGRARRICSHKDLPKEFQTVEVFVYLMVFSPEQLKSDDAIELKRKDLSKREPKVPVTSDQLLFEISSIKENVSNQLTKIIKETSFDCSLYPHGNENIVCLNFADPKNTSFSYVPDYAKQQSDVTVKTNKKKIEWTGKSITIHGVEYVYRRMSPKLLNIYDINSYKQALENPDINPILIGTLELNNKGEQVFKLIS